MKYDVKTHRSAHLFGAVFLAAAAFVGAFLATEVRAVFEVLPLTILLPRA